MKKQQKLQLDGEKWTKVYLHRVGYNGLTKRLSLPGKWCIRNGVTQYDKLVIIEGMRDLKIMSEAEFRRLYQGMAIDEYESDKAAVRW